MTTNTKPMKKAKITLVSVLVLSLIYLSGCDSSRENEIIGFWKAVDVTVDVDTTSIRPEALQATIDMYKSYAFEFYENNSMNVMASGNTFMGRWQYDEKENLIKIRLDNSSVKEFTPLGGITDGQIINVNKTGIGDIIVVYEKVEKE